MKTYRTHLAQIPAPERALIAETYRTKQAKEVAAIHNVNEDMVWKIGRLHGVRKPRNAPKGKRETDRNATPLEQKISRMLDRTYVYNCQYRKIVGYELGEKDVTLLTDKKPIIMPLKKANWILEKQFLSMTR